MVGNNCLHLNGATMSMIVQHWLDNVQFRGGMAPKVGEVTPTNQGVGCYSFKVELLDRPAGEAAKAITRADVALLVEQLVVANLKLYQLCERKAAIATGARTLQTEDDAQKFAADDIALCKQRAALRAQINAALGIAGDSVKTY